MDFESCDIGSAIPIADARFTTSPVLSFFYWVLQALKVQPGFALTGSVFPEIEGHVKLSGLKKLDYAYRKRPGRGTIVLAADSIADRMAAPTA